MFPTWAFFIEHCEGVRELYGQLLEPFKDTWTLFEILSQLRQRIVMSSQLIQLITGCLPGHEEL